MSITKKMIDDSLRREIERLEAKLAKVRRRPDTNDDYEVLVGRTERELDAARRALQARA